MEHETLRPGTRVQLSMDWNSNNGFPPTMELIGTVVRPLPMGSHPCPWYARHMFIVDIDTLPSAYDYYYERGGNPDHHKDGWVVFENEVRCTGQGFFPHLYSEGSFLCPLPEPRKEENLLDLDGVVPHLTTIKFKPLKMLSLPPEASLSPPYKDFMTYLEEVVPSLLRVPEELLFGTPLSAPTQKAITPRYPEFDGCDEYMSYPQSSQFKPGDRIRMTADWGTGNVPRMKGRLGKIVRIHNEKLVVVDFDDLPSAYDYYSRMYLAGSGNAKDGWKVYANEIELVGEKPLFEEGWKVQIIVPLIHPALESGDTGVVVKSEPGSPRDHVCVSLDREPHTPHNYHIEHGTPNLSSSRLGWYIRENHLRVIATNRKRIIDTKNEEPSFEPGNRIKLKNMNVYYPLTNGLLGTIIGSYYTGKTPNQYVISIDGFPSAFDYYKAQGQEKPFHHKTGWRVPASNLELIKEESMGVVNIAGIHTDEEEPTREMKLDDGLLSYKIPRIEIIEDSSVSDINHNEESFDPMCPYDKRAKKFL